MEAWERKRWWCFGRELSRMQERPVTLAGAVKLWPELHISALMFTLQTHNIANTTYTYYYI